MIKHDLSVRCLNRLLICDPEAGRLLWRERAPEMFSEGRYAKEVAAQMWNTRWAGKPALAARHNCGYLMGRIFYKGYLAHRVIMAMSMGAWPDGEVDHINGNRTDNRIANLRPVGRVENSRNMRRSQRNQSGATGVHWVESRNKWLSSIRADGRSICLGYFDDFERAKQARADAEVSFGFHKNHGRAA